MPLWFAIADADILDTGLGWATDGLVTLCRVGVGDCGTMHLCSRQLIASRRDNEGLTAARSQGEGNDLEFVSLFCLGAHREIAGCDTRKVDRSVPFA
jgi:hypothetical protein